MGSLSFGHSLPIYTHLVCIVSTKTLINMSISMNIHRPYLCEPLGSYISQVNDSKDLIISYCSTFINQGLI